MPDLILIVAFIFGVGLYFRDFTNHRVISSDPTSNINNKYDIVFNISDTKNFLIFENQKYRIDSKNYHINRSVASIGIVFVSLRTENT